MLMTQAIAGVRGMLRSLTAILAITAILVVSAAANSHVGERDSHCEICCAANLAVHRASVPLVVHAPAARRFAPPPAALSRYVTRDATTCLTRGPPSFARCL